MPDLDRFSRPLWGEHQPCRKPSEDEIADYKEQEMERRIEQEELREQSRKATQDHDPTY